MDSTKLDNLCVIKYVKDKDHWVVVVEGLLLSVPWETVDAAKLFCQTILGVSSWSQKTDMSWVAKRFDFQRRYRVPNHWSLDDALRSGGK